MLVTSIPEQRIGSGPPQDISGQLPAMPEVRQPEARATFNATQDLSSTARERPLRIDGPLPVLPRSAENESASLIQIWEGTVQDVLSGEGTMRALLQAKMGGVPDHFAEIGLEWVSEQDLNLVRPGAVFYLSLYKARRRGGTIVNSQELRFRRLPAWTRRDAASIKDIARHLLAKGKMNPEAP